MPQRQPSANGGWQPINPLMGSRLQPPVPQPEQVCEVFHMLPGRPGEMPPLPLSSKANRLMLTSHLPLAEAAHVLSLHPHPLLLVTSSKEHIHTQSLVLVSVFREIQSSTGIFKKEERKNTRG